MKDRLFRTKDELTTALNKDIRDRETMMKQGYNIKGISQVIQHKKKTLKSKTYWED